MISLYTIYGGFSPPSALRATVYSGLWWVSTGGCGLRKGRESPFVQRSAGTFPAWRPGPRAFVRKVLCRWNKGKEKPRPEKKAGLRDKGSGVEEAAQQPIQRAAVAGDVPGHLRGWPRRRRCQAPRRCRPSPWCRSAPAGRRRCGPAGSPWCCPSARRPAAPLTALPGRPARRRCGGRRRRSQAGLPGPRPWPAAPAPGPGDLPKDSFKAFTRRSSAPWATPTLLPGALPGVRQPLKALPAYLADRADLRRLRAFMHVPADLAYPPHKKNPPCPVYTLNYTQRRRRINGGRRP